MRLNEVTVIGTAIIDRRITNSSGHVQTSCRMKFPAPLTKSWPGE